MQKYRNPDEAKADLQRFRKALRDEAQGVGPAPAHPVWEEIEAFISANPDTRRVIRARKQVKALKKCLAKCEAGAAAFHTRLLIGQLSGSRKQTY